MSADVVPGAIRAAGGVVWRPGADSGAPEIAVVHRPKHQDWSLPKGKLHAGEHPLLAACREVQEETGVRPVVGPRLPTMTYRVPTSDGARDKAVVYWSMRAAATSPPFRPTDEVDQLRWVPVDEAPGTLTYPRDADLVAAFAALPQPTATVLLVRHSSAGSRDEWDGPDVTRPLDDTGRAQSDRLAALLALFAPDRAISATPRRCVQTLEPVARALGLAVDSDSSYDEESHERSPETAAERIRAQAAAGGVVVVCSQRLVIPDTVALLADVDGLSVPVIASEKGTTWALAFTGTTLVAAEHLAPPD